MGYPLLCPETPPIKRLSTSGYCNVQLSFLSSERVQSCFSACINNMKIVFLLWALFTTICKISCSCRNSYATICDSINDYTKYDHAKSTEVIIDASSLPSSIRRPVHMSVFSDVISLTIIGHLNGIQPEKECFGGSVLKFVNLYGNDLKILKVGSFPRMSKIYKLNLVENNIESIQAETFALCQPEIIDLSDNKIEVIETYTFTSPITQNLTKVIILENNKITTVDRYSLSPELRLLNLNKNSLSFIEKEVFEHLTKLETLVLSRNKFSTFSIAEFPQNLKLLDVSYNRITRLLGGSSEKKKNLEYLNLSHNKISIIQSNEYVGF